MKKGLAIGIWVVATYILCLMVYVGRWPREILAAYIFGKLVAVVCTSLLRDEENNSKTAGS